MLKNTSKSVYHRCPSGVDGFLVRFSRICAAGLLCFGLIFAPAVLKADSLSGSFTALPLGTNLNLTAEGQLDWGQFGLVNEWNYNHKYGLAQQISFNFITDTNDYYPYPDGPYLWNGLANSFSWSDGIPSRAATNIANGVYIFGDKLPGNNPTGFQIRCPANTNMEQLKLYVGTSGSVATLNASLGLLTYIDNTFNGTVGSPTNGVYTINFQASSPGQTMTVNFTGTDASGFMFLQAATLAGSNAPPSVAVTDPVNGAVFPAPATFTVTAAASDADGAVTNIVLLSGTNPVAQAAGATLSVTLTNQPGGTYRFTAAATDNAGLCVTSFPTTVFITTGGGTLSGSVAKPLPNVDLTAEGGMDWAHWGLVASSSFDSKASAALELPNVLPVNTTANNFLQYADNATAFTWSDGTPTATAFASSTGIFLYSTNTPPAAFQLTIPATNVPQRLKVYVGIAAVLGRLDAWLTDSSAVPYSDASLSSAYDNGDAVYTLVFASTNTGANLNVTWTPAIINDPFFGNVTWQAATLSQLPSPPQLQVLDPPPNQFSFSFFGQYGVNYTVLSSALFPPTSWQVLTNVTGTGANVVIVDSGNPASSTFYRVLAQ